MTVTNTLTLTRRYIDESILLAIVLTGLSYIIGINVGWIDEINWLEGFAVFTSYSCTWLCTRQSRWNYPIGVVTTAAYSLLFYELEMYALALFNLYLVGSLAYGWFRWGNDTNTRPVTNMDSTWGAFYVGIAMLIASGYLLINELVFPGGIPQLFTTDEGTFNYFAMIDMLLAVASGVAQIQLDNKQRQTWILWAAINIISIPYFIYTGLTLVAFQYIFFLANTYIGWCEWSKTMKVESNV